MAERIFELNKNQYFEAILSTDLTFWFVAFEVQLVVLSSIVEYRSYKPISFPLSL